MTYAVNLTDAAKADLVRLYRFQLQRSPETAERAEQAIRKAFESLSDFPFANRKIDSENSFLREQIIAFGSSGYVALFEILDDTNVLVLAVRHQLEEDYH